MKKNKMMRIASVLLVAVLISTCAIAGTYAKYVTKAEATDTARVAKWGVLITVNGTEAFADKYQTHDKEFGYEGEYSVVAFAEEGKEADKVVAPGTSSDDLDQTLSASIKGKPEVATAYVVEITDIKDIVLRSVATTATSDSATGTEEAEAVEYAPLLWTLKVGGVALATDKSLTEVLARVDEIAGKLEALNLQGVTIKAETVGDNNDGIKITVLADPNVDIDMDVELSWKWVYFVDNATDVLDTALGNIAAGVAVDGYEADLEVSAKVAVTAVQID
jgi:hypothetical protein